MQNTQEVVITGAGIVTPLGLNTESYVDALLHSKSAIQQVPLPSPVGDRQWYVSKVSGFDAKKYVQPRKTIKLICEETQFAFGATMMACEQSGIQAGVIDPDRLSVCFGGEIIFSDVFEVSDLVRQCSEGANFDYHKWAPPFMSNIYPLWMLRSLPNIAACHMGIALDARGPVNTITTDETSALMAIHEAYLMLQRGAADVVVVGACSSYVNPTRMLQLPTEHYAECGASDPATVVKPFDKNRTGMARGQGAGCLILERSEHAAARNAPVLGKLLSVASGYKKPSTPRSGSADSITATLDTALQRAGIRSNQLDHVNTGAGGARVLDTAYDHGVAALDASIPLVAVQGGMGNIGVATGMCETIASIAVAQSGGKSPHTVNYFDRDPALKGVVQNEPGRTMQRPYVAKVSQTPHGQTAALIFQLLDL